jgi:pyruvate dehydrogenase complex dehydrogenase (E1) component
MPKRLRRLTIVEGSLVDRPANPGARIMLFKRDGEVEKARGSMNFDEAMADQKAEELLDRTITAVCQNISALRQSLDSIVKGEDETDKSGKMRQSIEQFFAAMEKDVPQIAEKRRQSEGLEEVVRESVRKLLLEHLGSTTG